MTSLKIKKNSKRIFHCLPLLIELLAVNTKDIFTLNDDKYSLVVDRHNGRLIFLEYTGEGEINTTALFVGKGITFDTGGLDIKGM